MSSKLFPYHYARPGMLVALLGTSVLVPSAFTPVAQAQPATGPISLADVITALGDKRITATLIKNKADIEFLRLTGTLKNEGEIQAAQKIAEFYVPRTRIISTLLKDEKAPLQGVKEEEEAKEAAEKAKASKKKHANEEEYTDTWDLRLQGTSFKDLDGTVIAAEDTTKADNIKSALNSIYKKAAAPSSAPTPSSPLISISTASTATATASTGTASASSGGGGAAGANPVEVVRNKLVLRSTPKNLLLMKRDLVQLDSAAPQVQLDVYAVQVSGKGDQIEETVKSINTELITARGKVKGIHEKFGAKVSSLFPKYKDNDRLTADWVKDSIPNYPSLPILSDSSQNLLVALDKVGMDTNPQRRMSFAETLIFLAVLDNKHRGKVFDELSSEGIDLKNLQSIYVKPEVPGAVLVSAEPSEGQQTFLEFLATLYTYQHLDEVIEQKLTTPLPAAAPAPVVPALRYDPLYSIPEKLARQADIFDALHAKVGEAYAADIKALVIDNLLIQLKNKRPESGKKSGTSLAGQTRLVVSSGMQTSLKPTLQAAVDVTRPTPLTFDEAAALKTAVSAVIPALNASKAIGLGAALTEDPKVFATIAPGVGINVRPTVYPNASAARLQIDANFGVDSALPKQKEGSTNPQPPVLDAVKSHRVVTDVNVDALDLFGISSLNMDTKVPQSPIVVPILGRLPLVGPAFQFPRKDARIKNYSVIFVNTVILPRALDVSRYYGGTSDPNLWGLNAFGYGQYRYEAKIQGEVPLKINQKTEPKPPTPNTETPNPQ